MSPNAVEFRRAVGDPAHRGTAPRLWPSVPRRAAPLHARKTQGGRPASQNLICYALLQIENRSEEMIELNHAFGLQKNRVVYVTRQPNGSSKPLSGLRLLSVTCATRMSDLLSHASHRRRRPEEGSLQLGIEANVE